MLQKNNGDPAPLLLVMQSHQDKGTFTEVNDLRASLTSGIFTRTFQTSTQLSLLISTMKDNFV